MYDKGSYDMYWAESNKDVLPKNDDLYVHDMMKSPIIYISADIERLC